MKIIGRLILIVINIVFALAGFPIIIITIPVWVLTGNSLMDNWSDYIINLEKRVKHSFELEQ